MATRFLPLVLISLFIFAMSGLRADCARVEPSVKEMSFYLEAGEHSQAKTMTVYVERGFNGDPCSIGAKEDRSLNGIASIYPNSIIHNNPSYGIYSFVVNVTNPGVTNITNGTIFFYDSVSDAELFRLNLSVTTHGDSLRTLGSSLCANDTTGSCHNQSVFMPTVQPGLIEKNWGGITLILGFLMVFSLVVLVFFLAIRGS